MCNTVTLRDRALFGRAREESPGTTFDYAYDEAGNRAAVRENGAVGASHSYNAANQVVGWQYDAAGNLLDNGTTSYSYDALNRLLSITTGSQQRAYAYNGDGVLVQQTANGVTTRLTQDLAAPLAQVLQTTANGTTTAYVYGQDRLLKLDGLVRTWYGGDALGSVRQTLDDAGAPLTMQHYDPWGTPEGAAATPLDSTVT